MRVEPSELLEREAAVADDCTVTTESGESVYGVGLLVKGADMLG